MDNSLDNSSRSGRDRILNKEWERQTRERQAKNFKQKMKEKKHEKEVKNFYKHPDYSIQPDLFDKKVPDFVKRLQRKQKEKLENDGESLPDSREFDFTQVIDNTKNKKNEDLYSNKILNTDTESENDSLDSAVKAQLKKQAQFKYKIKKTEDYYDNSFNRRNSDSSEIENSSHVAYQKKSEINDQISSNNERFSLESTPESFELDKKYMSIPELKKLNIDKMTEIRQEARNLFTNMNMLASQRFNLQSEAHQSKKRRDEATKELTLMGDILRRQQLAIAKEHMIIAATESNGLFKKKNRPNAALAMNAYLLRNKMLNNYGMPEEIGRGQLAIDINEKNKVSSYRQTIDQLYNNLKSL